MTGNEIRKSPNLRQRFGSISGFFHDADIRIISQQMAHDLAGQVFVVNQKLFGYP